MDTKSLTIDFRKLKKLTVRDRLHIAKSPMGEYWLSLLTPSQYAQLFPSYYKKAIPGSGGVGGAVSGGVPMSGYSSGGGGTTATPVGRGGYGQSGDTNGSVSERPSQSPDYTPSWIREFEKATGQQVHERSSQQPAYEGRRIDRSNFTDQLKNPHVMAAFAGRMNSEVGSQGPEAQLAFAEEVFNRAQARNQTLMQALSGDYYPTSRPGSSSNPNFHSTIMRAFNEGTNTIKGATGNASQMVGFGQGRARKQADGSVWAPGQVATIGGERFGVEAQDKHWVPKYLDLPPGTSDNQSQGTTTPGQLMPEPSLRPGMPGTPGGPGPEQPPIPQNFNELNRVRPAHRKGEVQFIGSDRKYPYGSGRAKDRPSVPYGTYDIKPGLHYGNLALARGNSFYVKDMFDPKVNRNRQGILFHHSTDLDRLYSSGCIAVDKRHWPEFRQHMLDYMKQHGSIEVKFSPDGSALIGPKGSTGLGPNQLSTIGGAVNSMKLPDGLAPGIVDYFNSKLTSSEQQRFISNLGKLGAESVSKLNEWYGHGKTPDVRDFSNSSTLVRELQADTANIRKGGLQPDLKDRLDYAARQAGIEVDVTSGGQRMPGAPGSKGTHEHDKGGAADFNVYVKDKDGKRRLLDYRNPEDAKLIGKFTEEFGKAGGRSAGAGYMDDPTKIHMGISRRGPAAYDGPDWFREAWKRGYEKYKQEGFDLEQYRKDRAAAQEKQSEYGPHISEMYTEPGVQEVMPEPSLRPPEVTSEVSATPQVVAPKPKVLEPNLDGVNTHGFNIKEAYKNLPGNKREEMTRYWNNLTLKEKQKRMDEAKAKVPFFMSPSGVPVNRITSSIVEKYNNLDPAVREDILSRSQPAPVSVVPSATTPAPVPTPASAPASSAPVPTQPVTAPVPTQPVTAPVPTATPVQQPAQATATSAAAPAPAQTATPVAEPTKESAPEEKPKEEGGKKVPAMKAGGEVRGENLVISDRAGQTKALANDSEKLLVVPKHRISDEEMKNKTLTKQSQYDQRSKETRNNNTIAKNVTQATQQPKPIDEDFKKNLAARQNIYGSPSTERAYARANFAEHGGDRFRSHYESHAANISGRA